MDAADHAWLEAALDEWQAVEIRELGRAAAPLPEVIAIDADCTYAIRSGDFSAMTAMPHGETITLPTGEEAPLGPIAFASGGDAFVMSLPSVWRAAGVDSEFGLERLMTGVLLHEIMHVKQTALLAIALDPTLAAHEGLEDSLSDDLLQESLQRNAGYVAAYETERDLLYAAAAAASDEEAGRFAAEALEAMRSRRARFFTGEQAHFTELDDVFLTMEGMGQWLIYRYFRSPEGGGASEAQAVAGVRRGRRWWTQDEGLALILVIDRLLPGWQERASRDPDWRAERLLAAAVER